MTVAQSGEALKALGHGVSLAGLAARTGSFISPPRRVAPAGATLGFLPVLRARGKEQ
jgi:hypothetical protein